MFQLHLLLPSHFLVLLPSIVAGVLRTAVKYVNTLATVPRLNEITNLIVMVAELRVGV